jgi:hypothetical protein
MDVPRSAAQRVRRRGDDPRKMAMPIDVCRKIVTSRISKKTMHEASNGDRLTVSLQERGES